MRTVAVLNRSEQKQSLHKTGFNLTLSQVIGKNDRTNRERMLVPVHYRFLIIRSWFIQIISRWCQFSSWISSLDTKCSSNECREDTNLYRLQYFGRSLVQSFTFRPRPLHLCWPRRWRSTPTDRVVMDDRTCANNYEQQLAMWSSVAALSWRDIIHNSPNGLLTSSSGGFMSQRPETFLQIQ